MRIHRPFAGARTGRVAAGVIVLATTFLALPTGPATGEPDIDPQNPSQSDLKAHLPGVTTLIADNPADGLPGFDDLPVRNSFSVTEGTVTSSQHAVARRSKMSITSRLIWGAMYFGEFNIPTDSPTSFNPLCILQRHCLSDPFYQPSCATDDPVTHWKTNYVRNPMYPLKPLEDGGAEVGVLSEEKINLIAFGTIPATATLTMSVPRVDGKVQPLMAHMWGRMSDAAWAKGCAPLPSDLHKVSTLLEGKIIVQLSDLEIDGVQVDLGPRCRTKQPTQVYLWGDAAVGSYTPGGGGPLGAFDGLHPGSRGPLNDPYYREDNGRTIPPSSGINIPPFVDCGTGGDDLSPVVSAMASGPNNPVRAVQKPIVPLHRIPLEDLSLCGGSLCPLPAPEVPPMPPLPDGEGE